jgi:hypothetical protein
MPYQILVGTDREFEVVEYPTHRQEKELHELFRKTTDAIVSRQTKERVCDRWGWYDQEDGERVYDDYITGEVTDQGEYHLRLAKVIFEDAEDLSSSDVLDMRPGLVQEARVDFIAGCQGRSGTPDASSTEALQATIQSLLAQSGPTTTTTSPPSTAER